MFQPVNSKNQKKEYLQFVVVWKLMFKETKCESDNLVARKIAKEKYNTVCKCSVFDVQIKFPWKDKNELVLFKNYLSGVIRVSFEIPQALNLKPIHMLYCQTCYIVKRSSVIWWLKFNNNNRQKWFHILNNVEFNQISIQVV